MSNTGLSNRVEKKSRENSRDRPRDDKEKKKKNKLVFKNNIMNKLDIPIGNPGAMTQRNLGLGLNNNLINTNTNNNQDLTYNVNRKPSIDESNIQDELKDKLNSSDNEKRNTSPTKEETIMDSIPELNLQAMNTNELTNVGHQILNQNNEDVCNDLQKLINNIKKSSDLDNNKDDSQFQSPNKNENNELHKRPNSSASKDNRPNSLSQLNPHCQTYRENNGYNPWTDIKSTEGYIDCKNMNISGIQAEEMAAYRYLMSPGGNNLLCTTLKRIKGFWGGYTYKMALS